MVRLVKDYDHEIRYHPGKVNVTANALSKMSQITTHHELQ